MDLIEVDNIPWDEFIDQELMLTTRCSLTPVGDYFEVFVVDEDGQDIYKIFQGYIGPTNKRL